MYLHKNVKKYFDQFAADQIPETKLICGEMEWKQ